MSTVLAGEGRDIRAVMDRLAETAGVRGALLVARDGLVIASALRGVLAVEAIAALAATLGRELELRTSVPQSAGPGVAQFASEGGTLLLGATTIGFVIVLAADAADRARLAADVRDAVATIERAWRPPSGR